MSSFTLRPAVPSDAPHILSLIRALALFEKTPGSVAATEDLIRKNCFPASEGGREGGVARVVLAEVEGEKEPVGMALYFFNFSTWTGRPGLYLEDLFVKEEFRKLGVGKALFKELGRIAKEKECGRIEWVVLDARPCPFVCLPLVTDTQLDGTQWNTPAKDFYTKKLGAKHQAEWEIMRLEGEGIDRLAELS